MSTISPHDWFNQQLRLDNFEQLGRYFVPPSSRGVSKLACLLSVKVHRLFHFIHTGIWIDHCTVGQTINAYRYGNECEPKRIKEIKRDFRVLLGSGFYKRALKEGMGENLADHLTNGRDFLFRFIKAPDSVGAVLPSSPWLAKKIVAPIENKAENEAPRHYLEVGPGTGSFTTEIIKQLRPKDHLDLVEFDPAFCNILRRKFGHLKNVAVHQASITEWRPQGYRYDAVVSGLPLNAFPKEMVEKVYSTYGRIIKKGGILTYFDYPYIPGIKKLFLLKEQKRSFEQVLKLKDKFYREHEGSSDIVWMNMPPANVHCCRV